MGTYVAKFLSDPARCPLFEGLQSNMVPKFIYNSIFSGIPLPYLTPASKVIFYFYYWSFQKTPLTHLAVAVLISPTARRVPSPVRCTMDLFSSITLGWGGEPIGRLIIEPMVWWLRPCQNPGKMTLKRTFSLFLLLLFRFWTRKPVLAREMPLENYPLEMV